jgi:hypothetical protein
MYHPHVTIVHLLDDMATVANDKTVGAVEDAKSAEDKAAQPRHPPTKLLPS